MAGLRARLLAATIAGALFGTASALSLTPGLPTSAAASGTTAEPVARAVPAPRLPPPPDTRPVVAFGDSLTDGFGVPASESYPAVLQGLLGQTVIRRGFPGKPTAVGASELPGIIALGPRLVIVAFGSVDACLGVPAAMAAANLETILTSLDAHHIPAVIVGTHLGPERIPLPACVNYTPYERNWDSALTALAARHGSGLVLDILHGLGAQRDGYHPDVPGYAAMAERMLPTVRAIEALDSLPF
jgi:acyl-CoA thioesterase-1